MTFQDFLINLSKAGYNRYLRLFKQASKPATPSNGITLFSDSLGRLCWIGENGKLRILDGTANTDDRAYTLADASGGIPVIGSPTTWAGVIEYRTDFGGGTEGGYTSATLNSGAYAGGSPTSSLSGSYGSVSTGTNTNGSATVRTFNQAFNSANGKLWTQFIDISVSALSDGTNTYTAYVGFGNSAGGGSVTSGAYFFHDNGSPYWKCATNNTAEGGGQSTPVVTSVPVKVWGSSAGDKLDVKIEGGVAKFWINDVLVATISTNVPSNWTGAIGSAMWILKSAGTTARLLYADAAYARQVLTTPRNFKEPTF